MRYHEFRNQLQSALKNAGLLVHCVGSPSETVDLESMGRRWKVYIVGSSTKDTEPFYVGAKIAFSWDPFDSARSYTCEEDLLTELLGRTKSASITKPRFIRVDLELFARLPYGSKTVIPKAQIFGSWADAIKKKLDKVIIESKWRQERLVAVLGSLQEIKIQSKCDPAGHLSIEEISIEGFRIVRVPRMWDDPDRRDAEKSAAAELLRLARKFQYSLDEWRASMVELARRIRYTPPPMDAKQIEPPLEEEDEEGEMETIH